MTTECLVQLPGSRLPDPYRLVLMASGQQPAIRRPGDAESRVVADFWIGELPQAFTLPDVPDLRAPTSETRREHRAVGRPGQAVRSASEFKLPLELPGFRVPEPDRTGLIATGEGAPVRCP